jgi:ribosomal protein S18 acetylase RimI-like enzyme
MTVTAHFLHERPLDFAAAAMERGYEGYPVPIRCTAEMLATRIRREHIDPMSSIVYESDGAPAGILLVARRGFISRIAALCFAPALRGHGLGRAALASAIEAARRRSDRCLVLEVIESNQGALALYEAMGFRRRRRLVGYGRAEQTMAAPPGLVEPCDLPEAAHRLLPWSDRDLPWQLSPESFVGALPPMKGFVLRDQAVALLDDSDREIRLVAIAVAPGRRRRGVGSALISALVDRHPRRRWSIPAIVPEDIASGFLFRAGWARSSISQWEMHLDLSGTPAARS